MGYVSTNDNQKASDNLAKAKALKYAVAHKAISYEEAKIKAEALLQKVNEAGQKIAKKFGRKHRRIRFSDL